MGAYPPSKAFQILSTYKLKQHLLASLYQSIAFCFIFCRFYFKRGYQCFFLTSRLGLDINSNANERSIGFLCFFGSLSDLIFTENCSCEKSCNRFTNNGLLCRRAYPRTFFGTLFRVRTLLLRCNEQTCMLFYSRNCAPAKATATCTDQEIADRLWKLSVEAVGLEKSSLCEF